MRERLIFSLNLGMEAEEEEILSRLGEVVEVEDYMSDDLIFRVFGMEFVDDIVGLGDEVVDSIVTYLEEEAGDIEDVMIYDAVFLRSGVLGRVIIEGVRKYCEEKGMRFGEVYGLYEGVMNEGGFIGVEYIIWDGMEYGQYLISRVKN